MKTIKFKLNTESINNAINELKKYRDSLPGKCQEFVDRLVSMGISVASMNTGDYTNYIEFSKEVNPEKYGATAIMKASSENIVRRWLTKEGVMEAEVSPILMAEFGSGNYASNAGSGQPNASLAMQLGMGQGTFPGQTHAFDEEWHWLDLSGEWHSSSGEIPTMPVFKAFLEMENDVKMVAKEVFNS